MAAEHGHKSSERRLFLFQWQVRASKMKTQHILTEKDLMAHQMHDSALKTWMVGSHSQMYNSTILPPQVCHLCCIQFVILAIIHET